MLNFYYSFVNVEGPGKFLRPRRFRVKTDTNKKRKSGAPRVCFSAKNGKKIRYAAASAGGAASASSGSPTK